MRPHPYLRAYMAGITVPVLFLLVIMTADAVHRLFFETTIAPAGGLQVPLLERALVFPMAAVPNLWGVWNILYLALHRVAPRWPLGLHGALLVPILVPSGIALGRLLGVVDISFVSAVPVIPVAMAIYYLLWKFGVGFLNRELGIG